MTLSQIQTGGRLDQYPLIPAQLKFQTFGLLLTGGRWNQHTPTRLNMCKLQTCGYKLT